MIELLLAGGVVVAVLGVVQATDRRRAGSRSVWMIRQAIARVEGPDAEALQAEFRRRGLAPPAERPLTGFLF